MSTVGEFFQKELEGKELPAPLLAGEIEGLRVCREPRQVQIEARFPEFVEYSGFVQLGEALKGFGRVEVLPRFPSSSFSPACMPSLAAALKEHDATLNGTFHQAQASWENGTLTVELRHGGFPLLEARHTDERLQELVQAWFSVSCKVAFTGKSASKSGGGLLERIHHQEEKQRREQAIQQMEAYEEAMKEQASRRKISVRGEENLLPAIVP